MAISLNLADNRRFFWQWDTEQYLIAEELPVGAEIHFDMPECNIPMKTLVESRNDILVARVPDELLQNSGSFTVWAYVLDSTVGDAIGNRTVYSRSFDVNKREKPPGYVYTATEMVNYESLDSRLSALEEKLEGDTYENRMVLADTETNATYQLTVVNGKLTMTEVTE